MGKRDSNSRVPESESVNKLGEILRRFAVTNKVEGAISRLIDAKRGGRGKFWRGSK